jgi:hypothetical protein
MNKKILAGMSLALCVSVAHSRGSTDHIGDSATAWLNLQASNQAAAPAQPMLGAEAGAAYARYLKSFNTAIPESYGSSFQNGGRPSLDIINHDSQ